jgi:hypothetical protein
MYVCIKRNLCKDQVNDHGQDTKNDFEENENNDDDFQPFGMTAGDLIL